MSLQHLKLTACSTDGVLEVSKQFLHSRPGLKTVICFTWMLLCIPNLKILNRAFSGATFHIRISGTLFKRSPHQS